MSRGKKILISILGLLVIALIGFLCIGWFSGQQSYQSTVNVNATPEQCWRVLQNPGYMELWMEGFEEIEFVSGVPGEIGSEYRLLFKDGEEMNALIEKLTVMDENERLGFEMRNDFLTGTIDIQLVPSENGTTITGTTVFQGQNALLESLFVIMNSSIAEADQKNYNKLKEVIETKSK